MSFTDDDLKRLETAITPIAITEFSCRAAVLNIRGLIARLEAAERVCQWYQQVLDKDGVGNVHLLEAWRKAKGL